MKAILLLIALLVGFSGDFAYADSNTDQALKNARSNVSLLPYGIRNYAHQDLNTIEQALKSCASPPASCDVNLPKCVYYANYGTIRINGKEVGYVYTGSIDEKAGVCDKFEALGASCGKKLGVHPNTD
jgi:hypothetical protein